MVKHWARNLNDVGKVILYHATDQENRLLTIKRMKDEIVRLEKDYEDNEKRILAILEGEWTAEEISQAKTNAPGR